MRLTPAASPAPLTEAAASADPFAEPEPTGSNGMAIAPSNTAGRHALLLINPHTSFFFRSELQMTSDQGLNAYGAALGNIPADQLDRVKTSYATVELTDGVNQSGMDLVGRLRANAPDVENSIQSLEADSLSTDPDLNTEVSVLNKINAANVIALRNRQDTNKLLVTLAEQQIIEAKRKRDAEATAINSHIQFMTQEQAVLHAQTGDPSARMLAYRMP